VEDDEIKEMNDLNVAVNIAGLLNNTTKIRQIDLNEVIDKNWKDSIENKMAKNEMWHYS
jgi:hypothetical protein